MLLEPTSAGPDAATVEEVCQLVSEGESLGAALQEAGLGYRTWMEWHGTDPETRRRYAAARDRRAELVFEQLLTIADTPEPGTKTVEKVMDDGTSRTETTTGDMIEHRRLKCDVRKWVLSRMDPRKYGERVEVEHSGSVAALTPQDVRAALADSPLLRQLQAGPVVDVPAE